MIGKYFEDLETGSCYRTDGVTVTEEAIIRFAFDWDPQPFHIDRVAAANSMFGQVIASGLHTLMWSYRLYYDHGLLKGTALAGLGIDEVRFVRPLTPGTTIHVLISVVEKRPSRTPGRGTVRIKLETRNERNDPLLSMYLSALVACRPAG
jgi:acyl dehydratase